jgi:hypothetical protein
MANLPKIKWRTMIKPRTICWFSCGAASAIATRLALRDNPDAIVAYCATGSEHPDNERFMADCSEWFDAPVIRLQSEKYKNTWDVWEKRKFLSGVSGAPCTLELKFLPRINTFDLPSDIHVFGYTADAPDITRANRMRETYPNMNIKTPLIDAGLNKANVLAMIEGAGIALPPTYAMGFQNNNCIPCVKATSPDYWSLVRFRFPDEFERMVKLSRHLNVRLTRINDERIFIDEIPIDWPMTNPIQPACDFMCSFAESPTND